MKKIVSILVIILLVTLSVGVTNMPATSNQNSLALSSQEMQTIVGGKPISCYFVDFGIFGHFGICW